MTALPNGFDDAFLQDIPYDPAVLLFDRIEEIDAEQGVVRCRMPTHDALPFTEHQRTHPERHPPHVAGAVLIHATGMLGLVHAYYVLGLRHAEGWIGYGTHIHSAAFRKLVPLGSTIDARCQATKVRKGRDRYLVRYTFAFEHDGERCYDGDQTAMWLRVAAT
jgi:hypothetical protein